MNRVEMQRQQRIADHEQGQLDQQREQHQRELANAETRRKYLARLESEKAEKERAAQLELDAELEPQKQVQQRQWLANNPNRTAADFDRLAWQHLRENLIQQRREQEYQLSLAAAHSRFGNSL